MDEKETPPPPETLDQLHARHRKELRDLQSRITQKKKNATKKTRKGVNDECADLERSLKDQHAAEIRRATGPPSPSPEPLDEDQDDEPVPSVEALHLSPHPRDKPQPPSQHQLPPNGPKKDPQAPKQNRHRARLARRAAEQAQAADAAAAEAAAQPDRRAAERAAMERAFKEHSLREKDIEPDGHCLFSAVADQLGVNGIELAAHTSSPSGNDAAAAYKVVRHRAAEYITKHPDEFAGFLEEPVGDYAARIRDTAEWGGELELSALARAYGVEIRVVQDGRTEVVAPFEDREGDADGEGRKTLWLAYYRHGYGLGEHYNSLRKGGTGGD